MTQQCNIVQVYIVPHLSTLSAQATKINTTHPVFYIVPIEGKQDYTVESCGDEIIAIIIECIDLTRHYNRLGNDTSILSVPCD